jgi:hypothetical protein
MQNLLRFCGSAPVALAFAALAPSAGAEELRNHDLCRQSRGMTPEQLSGGHMLWESVDICETVEGATKGAIWTSYGMWEADDKGMTKDRGGYAIGRKPGSINICQDITQTGSGEPILTDGKVTGWTASGQCLITVSTGDWAALGGKTWYWTATSTGPQAYEIHSEVK